MREQFISHKFRKSTLKLIGQSNEIIAEYQSDGLTLTVRQLYYQFVARGLLKNSKQSYKTLGENIANAREAGLIDWLAIEDRSRSALKVTGEVVPREVVLGLEHGIVIDPWEEQDIYPEVWIEKDALLGTIERVCDDFRVTRMASKGYLSAS